MRYACKMCHWGRQKYPVSYAYKKNALKHLRKKHGLHIAHLQLIAIATEN